LPNLLAMFVGTWIDRRLHKRRIMVAADLMRAGVLILLPIAYWQDMLSMPLLYAIAILTGVGGVIFNLPYHAFYVSLVRPKSYVNANSKLDTARATSQVAGPAIGGTWSGIPCCGQRSAARPPSTSSPSWPRR
jgi:MFS family permease